MKQEREEAERLKKERLERERKEKEKKEADRLEKERLAKQQEELDKKERDELERVEKEELKQYQEAQERIQQEELERYIKEQQKLEEEKLKKFQEEQESLELERKVAEELNNRKYAVILCDPPWRYDFAETKNREIENQYPTMDLKEIKSLDIPAGDDCVLFMWATAPKLEQAFEVLKAWGFEYKTCAVWDKEIIGMGYWFRGQHELLLVATKGKPIIPSEEHRVSSVIREKRGKHSKKPECVYKIIENMVPSVSYIEMFARNTRDNWVSWGNQV